MSDRVGAESFSTRAVGWLIGALAAVTGAWRVFASEALGGNPQWFTLPMGIALLLMGIAIYRGLIRL